MLLFTTLAQELCSQFLFKAFVTDNVHIFCKQLLFTTFVHKLCLKGSMTNAHNFCLTIIFTYFVNNLYSQLLFTTIAPNLCLQLSFISIVHNFISKLLFTTIDQVFLLLKFKTCVTDNVHNFCSQLLFKKFVHSFNFCSNFCAQLLLPSSVPVDSQV